MQLQKWPLLLRSLVGQRCVDGHDRNRYADLRHHLGVHGAQGTVRAHAVRREYRGTDPCSAPERHKGAEYRARDKVLTTSASPNNMCFAYQDPECKEEEGRKENMPDQHHIVNRACDGSKATRSRHARGKEAGTARNCAAGTEHAKVKEMKQSLACLPAGRCLVGIK